MTSALGYVNTLKTTCVSPIYYEVKLNGEALPQRLDERRRWLLPQEISHIDPSSDHCLGTAV